MTLPTTNLGFRSINTEMGRTASQQFSINDAEGRKLAAAGNTGQNLTDKTEVRLSRFKGHARSVVSLTSNNNVDLKTSVQSGHYAAGLTYATYSVGASVIIGSSSTSTPALTCDNFTSGDLIELINGGTIVGAGGDGGKALGGRGQNRGFADDGYAGLPGGPAFYVNYPITVTNNNSIWGGGGGGGGGDGTNTGGSNRGPVGGGGGGGGAGSIPGAGGPGGTNSELRYGDPGNPGTLTAGGIAGQRYTIGGNGGNPGQKGYDAWYSGGAAGNAIQGVSKVTFIRQGDIQGERI